MKVKITIKKGSHCKVSMQEGNNPMEHTEHDAVPEQGVFIIEGDGVEVEQTP